MKKQVCKDCYYAGFDKCDHIDETEYLKQGENGKKLKESISQLKPKVMEYRIEFHKDNIFRVIRITHADLRFLQEEKQEEVFKGSISECKDYIDVSKRGVLTKKK